MLREKFSTSYKKELTDGSSCSWSLYEKLRFLESFINLKTDTKALSNSPSNSPERTSSVAKSSPLDEHALIKLIKQHPVLYDKKHDDFHSTAIRQKAWESISSKSNFPITILQRRWRVLRDRFVRELRRTQFNEDSNLNCSSFFKDMLFLAQHIRSKNYAVEANLGNDGSESKYEPDDDDESNSYDNDEWILQQQEDTQQDNHVDESYQYIEETEEIEEVYEEEISHGEYIEEEESEVTAAPFEEIEAIHENWEKSEAIATSSNLKRHASVEETQEQPEIKKRMKSQSPVNTLEGADKDEDMAFGNTIGCMLKKIPQHLKTSVKLKLLTSLAEFEAQHNLNNL